MTTRRELFALGLGALGGCVAVERARPRDDRALLRRLLAGSVHGREDVGPVLYSWTRRDQIDAIRAGGIDLAALFRPIGDFGGSTYHQRTGATGKLRFAWTNPWATIRGWDHRRRADYGDQLIRMVVAANPREYLSYHQLDDDVAREVVVLGPAALESWSYGTAEIRSELRDAADLLEALAVRAPLADPLLAAYRANLALANRNYAATPAQLQTCADLIRAAATNQGAPMIARVTQVPQVRCEIW